MTLLLLTTVLPRRNSICKGSFWLQNIHSMKACAFNQFRYSFVMLINIEECCVGFANENDQSLRVYQAEM